MSVVVVVANDERTMLSGRRTQRNRNWLKRSEATDSPGVSRSRNLSPERRRNDLDYESPVAVTDVYTHSLIVYGNRTAETKAKTPRKNWENERSRVKCPLSFSTARIGGVA